MTDSQRNFAILALLAVLGVVFSTEFGVTSGILMLLLQVAFTIAICALLVVLYRRNSGTIASMPATPRLVLQVAGITLLFAMITGTLAFLPYPFGWSYLYPLLFWPLLFACAFAMWWAWQQRTSRW